MEAEFKVLKELELELTESSTRKDADRLNQLLADNFQEFGKSGERYNKSEIISFLINEKPNKILCSGFNFTKISADAVLVTYQSACNNTNANRSSIWIKSGDQWKMLHHQGTRCE